MSVAKYKDPSTGEWTPIGLSVGGTSGMEMDLLWENASPTSEFEPQTISLDLTDYQCAIVMFLQGSIIIDRFRTYNFTSAVGRNYIRGLNMTDNGIDIGGGQIIMTYGDNSSVTTNNGANIPLRIYGIKSSIKGGN